MIIRKMIERLPISDIKIILKFTSIVFNNNGITIIMMRIKIKLRKTVFFTDQLLRIKQITLNVILKNFNKSF